MASAWLAEDDDAVVKLLEGANASWALQEEIGAAMRKGFVSLTSARMSKGLNVSRSVISMSFPEDLEAAVVVDCEAGESGDEGQSQQAVMRLRNRDERTECTPGDTPSAGTFLRQRKKPAAVEESPSSGTGSLDSPEPKPKLAPSKMERYLQQWLETKPRGQLVEAQKAFTSTLQASLKLASLNIKLRASIDVDDEA